jgi:hypothetical protein
MADPTNEPDLESDDELIPVTRESSRGGNEPPPQVNDRPDQNVAYDEAVKGRPLTDEERTRAELESPLAKPSKLV